MVEVVPLVVLDTEGRVVKDAWVVSVVLLPVAWSLLLLALLDLTVVTAVHPLLLRGVVLTPVDAMGVDAVE